VTAASLAVLAGVAFAVAASPLFQIKTVEISGTSELGRDDVLRAAGLRSDTNLITLSPGALEGRLEAGPWIQEATVERQFPSTLVIGITERRPVVTVRRNGAYWIVATDGVTLEESSRDPKLPPVRGARPAPVGESSAPVATAAAVAAAWPEVVLAEDPQIEIAPDGTISIQLRRDVVVDYGMPTDPGLKAQALAGVLDWSQRKKERLVSIDLRVPGAPAAELDDGSKRTVSEASPDTDAGGGKDDGNAGERDRTSEESPSPTP